jgi:hypothetical protein
MKLFTEIIALCDYATISREGKLSIGIFDEIRVQEFPGGIARAFLVATVHGKANTHYKLKIAIMHQDKAEGSLDLEVQTSPNGKSNIITEFVNLAFKREGDYSFIITDGDTLVGQTNLKVIHAQKQNEVTYKLPN